MALSSPNVCATDPEALFRESLGTSERQALGSHPRNTCHFAHPRGRVAPWEPRGVSVRAAVGGLRKDVRKGWHWAARRAQYPYRQRSCH